MFTIFVYKKFTGQIDSKILEWYDKRVINNIGSSSNNHPLSSTRAERSEKLEQALSQMRISLPQMGASDIAANREYGLKMVDDIAAARFLQPATSADPAEFNELLSRLQ